MNRTSRAPVILARACPKRVLIRLSGELVEQPLWAGRAEDFRWWRPGHSARAERLAKAFERDGLAGYIRAIRGPQPAAMENKMDEMIRPPGLYVQTGPPIHIIAVMALDGERLAATKYDLTPQQANELGAILLRLSGATEARAQLRGELQADAAFLKAAGVAT